MNSSSVGGSSKGTCGRCRSFVLSSVGGRRCCRSSARGRLPYTVSRLLSSSVVVVVGVVVGGRLAIARWWSTRSGRCRREWKVGWDPPPRLWGLGCFPWHCVLVWPVVGCGAQLCFFPLASHALMAPWQPCTSKCGGKKRCDLHHLPFESTRGPLSTSTLLNLMQPYIDRYSDQVMCLFPSFLPSPASLFFFLFFFPLVIPPLSDDVVPSCLHKLKLILKPRRPVIEAKQAHFAIQQVKKGFCPTKSAGEVQKKRWPFWNQRFPRTPLDMKQIGTFAKCRF